MPRVLCLLYHRINDYENDIYNMTVTPQNFEAHMKYLKEHYQIVKFDDDWESISGDAVVITFDDGYVDNYSFAVPILEKYRIPATIFVTTGNIDTNREFWWDEFERALLQGADYKDSFELCDDVYHYTWETDTCEKRKKLITTLRWLLRCDPYIERREDWLKQLRMWSGMNAEGRDSNISMSSQQLKELASSELITIGGHTVNHQSMGALSYAEQEKEISISLENLEKIIGRKVTTYSYPFGKVYDYNEETFQLLEKYGVCKAATTSERIWTATENKLTIPRVSVRNIEIEEFEKLVNSYF